ncbi:tetratricopeptide repeat-containing sensor histidine kinase [Reichenbachiella ulvae]|uniref:histidine kinase n=1 Tax=Reichenbachiella ulvae TaxID=2980104 RepID=A0ABT3CUF6_9BACT|nr:tetratricopeptide repeat-containing sensor histidine kinase [Reichenbachiella ulvae]MCV9387326.1 tetratricopeptide repeat-containing sensor histidine kinase [Reichenbachiella ulvae]
MATFRLLRGGVLKILFIFHLHLICSPTLAQQVKVDSLEQLLSSYPDVDTLRFSYLNSLSELLILNDTKRAIQYALEADSLSKTIGFQRGHMMSQLMLARCHTINSDLTLALQYSQASQALAEELGDITYQSRAFNQLGIISEYKGDYTEALSFYDRSLQLATEAGYQDGILNSYNNLGTISCFQGNHPKALEYYQRSLDLAQRINSKTGISIAYNNIGIVYYYQKNYDQSLKYYNKSLEIDLALEDKSGASKCYNNMAIIYNHLGEYDQALNYYEKSLEIKTELDDKIGVVRCFLNIADNYYSQEEYRQALDYFEKSLKGSEALGYQSDIVGSLLGIAKTQYQLGSYSEALQFGKKGFDLAEKLGKKDYIKEGAEIMSQIYAALSRYELAYQYHQTFKQVSDSLLNKDNIRKVTSLEEQFKFDKERQTLLLEQEVKEKILAAELKHEKNVLKLTLVALALLVLLLFVAITSYFSKKKAHRLLAVKNQQVEEINKVLAQTNETKNKFFRIISHDLRSPLSALVGLTRLIKQGQFKEEKQEELMEMLSKDSEIVLKLVENLLEWARSQSDNIPFRPEPLSLKSLADEALLEMEGNALEKQVVLDAENVEELSLFADKNMIKTILRNLLSNAIKFTPIGGKVSIMAIEEKGRILLSVQDTGVGMNQKQQDALFNIHQKSTTKGTNNEKGTGLGLLICKEFVEKHKGEIWVKSEEGLGTQFWVSIPK